jgi:hypothetical protein
MMAVITLLRNITQWDVQNNNNNNNNNNKKESNRDFLISNFRRVWNVVCFLLPRRANLDAGELPRRKHTTIDVIFLS